MAVVLDSVIPVGVALANPACTEAYENVSETGKCYMTIACVEEFACAVKRFCPSQLAEKWISWLFTNDNIRIIESEDPQYTSEDFVSLVAEAFAESNLASPAASAAALGRRLGAPVVTSRLDFRQLEDSGFCQVIWV